MSVVVAFSVPATFDWKWWRVTNFGSVANNATFPNSAQKFSVHFHHLSTNAMLYIAPDV